jgi:hypothetical protein
MKTFFVVISRGKKSKTVINFASAVDDFFSRLSIFVNPMTSLSYKAKICKHFFAEFEFFTCSNKAVKTFSCLFDAESRKNYSKSQNRHKKGLKLKQRLKTI